MSLRSLQEDLLEVVVARNISKEHKSLFPPLPAYDKPSYQKRLWNLLRSFPQPQGIFNAEKNINVWQKFFIFSSRPIIKLLNTIWIVNSFVSRASPEKTTKHRKEEATWEMYVERQKVLIKGLGCGISRCGWEVENHTCYASLPSFRPFDPP